MAVDMFINMGDKIKGETQDAAQKKTNDIDVLAWSWGMSQSGTTHMGKGGGAGVVNVQDLSITKYVDTASSAIMVALAKGSHTPKMKLLVRKAGEGQQQYITIEMDEVMITSVSTGGSGGEDRLTENVTLNFAKVKFDYYVQDDKGATKSAGTFHWDIAGKAPI
ncbi:MAG: type VI secretion system tube protein Hcp [Burkholderiales bacterium]|nr:type VI secretion system tube protein Hcp [Burkholderiales bacterium]MDE2277810.1 type VI secretion system tube protein Hcp [Burkholderiales bacterium]